jgi:hypothetical protein
LRAARWGFAAGSIRISGKRSELCWSLLNEGTCNFGHVDCA